MLSFHDGRAERAILARPDSLNVEGWKYYCRRAFLLPAATRLATREIILQADARQRQASFWRSTYDYRHCNHYLLRRFLRYQRKHRERLYRRRWLRWRRACREPQ